MKYFMRIIKVLAEHQQIGISNLATRSRMNHKRCAVIVKWMQQEGYLVVSIKNGKKTIKVTEEGMQHIKKLSSAQVSLPEFVDLEDSFTLSITDGDLNDRSESIETYAITLDGTGPFALHRNGDPIGSIASIEIIIAGIEPDFQVPLDYALVENGANTGVLESELNVQDLLASAGLSGSVGTGDVIIVSYTDATAYPSPIVSQDETTINFFVVPESPIGTIALLLSSVAALGTFLWMKKLRSRP